MSNQLETGSLSALRAQDPETAHILTLCIPGEYQRDDALVLLSLHGELARAHRVTSDISLGTIRIRWWLDAIDDIYRQEPPRQHPIVVALKEICQRHNLDRQLLEAKIESHSVDLEGLRQMSWSQASQVFTSQRGNLWRLLLQTQGIEQTAIHIAANHLGVAFGVWRAIPGLGTLDDIPWLQGAQIDDGDPDWVIQAITHLDEVDAIGQVPKWMRILSRYLRSGLMNVARNQLNKAYAQQKTAAFGLWRRTLV